MRRRSCSRSELASGAHLLLDRGDGAARLEERDELLHDARVVARPRVAAKLGASVLGPHLPAVWTVRQHRVVADDDAKDARGERDGLARQPLGIARAVMVLVRGADQRDHRAQEADRLEDARAEHRVLLDDLPLLRGELPRLRDDRRRDADLAERLEERGVTQVAHLIFGEAEPLPERDGVRGEAALVVLAVLVARLDHRRKRRHGRQVRLVELAVETDAVDRRRADPGEDADELALLVGERVRLLPGDEEHADRFVAGAQRLHEHGFAVEALERGARALGHDRGLAVLDGATAEDRRDRGGALRQAHEVGRRLACRRRELELVAALVEIHRRGRRAERGLDLVRDLRDERVELALRRQLETDAVEVAEPAGQRGGAVVEVRAVDGDGGLGRDRDEEVEVAVVVGGRARALRRDRADDGATQPQRCDDDRLLLHRPPCRAVREPERAAVALGVAEEERAFALDARAGERPGLHTLDRLELAPVVDEEAVAELLGVAPERRDVEGVRVHDRGDRAVDAAEHVGRVDRAADRAADLDERLEQTRAALRGEARADVDVAEEEERDARDEEPRLDDDDLDRDDRGEAPEDLRASRPRDP